MVGTLIFSYIRKLGSSFGIQKFELQYFIGFSEKTNIFWGMAIFFYFLGTSQNWVIFRGHFCAF